MPAAREAIDAATLEADLQDQVEQLLTLTGWKWFHDRAVNQDGAHINPPGFPDIIAMHPRTGHQLVLELKREGQKLRESQEEWADAAEAVERLSRRAVRYYIIEPASMDRLTHLIRTLAVTVDVAERMDC